MGLKPNGAEPIHWWPLPYVTEPSKKYAYEAAVNHAVQLMMR